MNCIINKENLCCKQPKSCGEGELIEMSDAVEYLENSCGFEDGEIIESNRKAFGMDSKAQSQSDSGVDMLSQNSLELLTQSTACPMEKQLLELENQVQQLKTENEALKSKSCLNLESQEKAIITVKINSLDNFKLFREKLLKIFELYANCEVKEQEADLLIKVIENDKLNLKEQAVVHSVETPTRRKKRKKRKLIETSDATDGDDVFMLDTTPSLSTKNNLQYESKFDFCNIEKEPRVPITPQFNSHVCFNCKGNHNLKDCTKPKDIIKINAARQTFKSQPKSKRYHLEDEQKYGHLQPGKISDKLQEALGLSNNQLPDYIYRMRHLGYPPGWRKHVTIPQDSGLTLFDFNGKDASDQGERVKSTKGFEVIEYHGFNVPLQNNLVNERLYGVGAYVKESSDDTINHIQIKSKEDNLETCDMEIDNAASDKETEEINPLQKDKEDERRNPSPTLTQLEIEKKLLLEQLTEDIDRLEDSTADSSVNGFTTIDITGVVDSFDDVPLSSTMLDVTNDDAETGNIVDLPKANRIKTSTFGTPILKSTSPFVILPKPENFMKDVSDVINFENLPNSTGKYEQMIGVIEKVRRILSDKQL
ncbi:hypothetical protein FQA39_LY01105 [Lamprigera yunnana]|nr:hypothetical protein FQA39_LY01105 [Lamprigera yunnana]